MAEEIGSVVEAGNPVEAAPVVATPVAAPDWLASVGNEELRTLATAKGWDKGGPESVLSSYHNLEKLFGADKAGRAVVMPGPDADATVMGEFYNKLGRPVKADGYELPIPAGQNDTMAKWASGVFHEAGLTTKQAQLVAQKWNEHMGTLQTDSVAQNTQSAQDADNELKREWGAAYDQKVRGIDQAAVSLKMTAEQLAGLRKSMGPAAAMRFVDGLAGKLGEAPMDSDGSPMDGGLMTPEAARSALSALSLDKLFMEAWLNKSHTAHGWALEKKQSLAKMASGVV